MPLSLCNHSVTEMKTFVFAPLVDFVKVILFCILTEFFPHSCEFRFAVGQSEEDKIGHLMSRYRARQRAVVLHTIFVCAILYCTLTKVCVIPPLPVLSFPRSPAEVIL